VKALIEGGLFFLLIYSLENILLYDRLMVKGPQLSALRLRGPRGAKSPALNEYFDDNGTSEN
jgi:hypothetical protein